jgi:acyl-CoA thioester hydrolase
MRWHESRVRVRFNEVDQWGVVWYANYFAYVESARGDVLAVCNLLPHELIRLGYTAPVVALSCQFKAPARFRDSLVVRMRLLPQETAKLVFEFRIVNEDTGTLVMEGETAQVLLDSSGRMIYKLKGPVAERLNVLAEYFGIEDRLREGP